MITSYMEYIDLLDNQERPASRRAVLEAVAEDVLLRTIHERPDLKPEVILNKFVPVTILSYLAADLDPDIRYWVARKRKLPISCLEKLARDVNDGVRREVVSHVKLTKQILEALATDTEGDIADVARRRLDDGNYRH